MPLLALILLGASHSVSLQLEQPLSSAPGLQSQPAVAYADGVWLVVWVDKRDRTGSSTHGSRSLFGARVAADGTVLDPHGMQLAAGPIGSTAYPPAVAACGGVFVVVWVQIVDGHAMVVTRRLLQSGELLDTEAVQISKRGVTSAAPAVACAGQHAFIVWSVGAASLDVDSGKVLPLDLGDDAWGFGTPRVAFNGEVFLVVWFQPTAKNSASGHIMARRYHSPGQPLDDAFPVGEASRPYFYVPYLSAGTGDFLAVWHPAHYQIRVVNVSSAGEVSEGRVLDSRKTAVGPIAFDGHTYLGLSRTSGPLAPSLVSFSATGQPTPGRPLGPAAPEAKKVAGNTHWGGGTVALAGGQQRTLVVWSPPYPVHRTGTGRTFKTHQRELDIVGVRTSGLRPLDAKPFTISTDSLYRYGPAVDARNGRGALAWLEGCPAHVTLSMVDLTAERLGNSRGVTVGKKVGRPSWGSDCMGGLRGLTVRPVVAVGTASVLVVWIAEQGIQFRRARLKGGFFDRAEVPLDTSRKSFDAAFDGEHYWLVSRAEDGTHIESLPQKRGAPVPVAVIPSDAVKLGSPRLACTGPGRCVIGWLADKTVMVLGMNGGELSQPIAIRRKRYAQHLDLAAIDGRVLVSWKEQPLQSTDVPDVPMVRWLTADGVPASEAECVGCDPAVVTTEVNGPHGPVASGWAGQAAVFWSVQRAERPAVLWTQLGDAAEHGAAALLGVGRGPSSARDPSSGKVLLAWEGPQQLEVRVVRP